MENKGALILDDVYGFLGRFIAYPSDQAHVAHALWIAHCHLIDAFDTTPRLAFLSAEPASGKTRALEITELLVPRPIEAVNMSPAALFRLVDTEDGTLPTILHDEIDTVFGPKAKEHEDIRGLINAGHRRGAKTWRCVMHNGGKPTVEPIEAFCPVALAGLDWLPDTIMSRAAVIRMKRRAPTEAIEPYRRRDHGDEGHRLCERLELWAAEVHEQVRDARPDLPRGIVDRDADKWEPLIASADAAGGAWPDRARAAAVVLVRQSQDHTPSLGIQLLADVRAVFTGERMGTEAILTALIKLPERPWADMKGKPINDRKLASLLRGYEVRSKDIRIADWRGKGYLREDLHDAWLRNLPPIPEKSATSATSATSEQSQGLGRRGNETVVTAEPRHVTDAPSQKPAPNGHVTDVADVTLIPGIPPGKCAHCGQSGDDLLTVAEPNGGIRLHRDCLDPWQALEIPPAFDRRQGAA